MALVCGSSGCPPTREITFQIGLLQRERLPNLSISRNPCSAISGGWKSIAANGERSSADKRFAMRKQERVTRGCFRLKTPIQKPLLRSTKSNRIKRHLSRQFPARAPLRTLQLPICQPRFQWPVSRKALRRHFPQNVTINPLPNHRKLRIPMTRKPLTPETTESPRAG